MRSLITAIRTLTLLPVPGRDADNFADSIPYFPAVGGLIGIIVAGILAAMAATGWFLGAGAIAAVAAVFLTRGLHIDGLADVADALGARGNIERRLAIMKDPHTGAFGVIAIVADILLKTVALTRIAPSGQWALAVVPFIASRCAQALVAVTLPYARREGGTAQAFVQQSRGIHLALALVVAAACAAPAGLPGLILLAVGFVSASLVRLWIKHTFGGVTGDLIGATNEVVETGLLVFLALTLKAA